AAFWRLYRDFFDLAERRRRWSLEKDIPWAQCNRGLDPAIADVVESFCAVELYLPDYLAPAVSRSRHSRAQAWFYANWGYEESKHSLALGDWLLQSGLRSEGQIADLAGRAFQHPWQLPHDSHVALLAYAMVRQRAARIKGLGIFDEDLYYREVYLPTLAALGVQRSEMRNRLPGRKSAPTGGTP